MRNIDIPNIPNRKLRQSLDCVTVIIHFTRLLNHFVNVKQLQL